MSKPKILVFDIETAPLLGYVWGIWEQNVGLEQIHTDWYVLSWSAKWLGNSKIMHMDQRNAKNLEDDRKILKGIWKLLDEADIVVTQNGKSFDQKKLNARFILNGFQPPSSYKHIDTKVIAKKHFGFTSNSLAYMSKKLCAKHKKLSHSKYPGFELWRACLAGDKAAWREMETYNKYDVLALEELYTKLSPWDSSVNFNVYSESEDMVCKCGSEEFRKRGFFFAAAGKYQRYQCKKCGHETRSGINLLPKEKRKSMPRSVTR